MLLASCSAVVSLQRWREGHRDKGEERKGRGEGEGHTQERDSKRGDVVDSLRGSTIVSRS